MKFFDLVDKIGSSPREWPTKVRRWYLCTLPISLPLHIITMVAIVIGCLIMIVVIEAVLWGHEVWTGQKTERGR